MIHQILTIVLNFALVAATLISMLAIILALAAAAKAAGDVFDWLFF